MASFAKCDACSAVGSELARVSLAVWIFLFILWNRASNGNTEGKPSAVHDAWSEHAGFAEQPLFEEVCLVKALRRSGTFNPLKASIEVSPRRWQRDGWIARTLHNRYLAIAFMLGANPTKLAQQYRREKLSS